MGACTAILGGDFKDGPLGSGSVDGASGEGGTGDGSNKDAETDATKDAAKDAKADTSDAHPAADAPKDSPTEHDAGKDAPTSVDASDAGDANDATPPPGGSCDTDASYCASACQPKTCAELGFLCGFPGDGCGGGLNCGSCNLGLSCGGDFAPGTCGMSACTARTCASAKIGCGPTDDGCGNLIQCGACPEGETCGGGGSPNACGSSLESCLNGTLQIAGSCPSATPACAKISMSAGATGEACAACAPGATQCTASQAQICSAAGVWTSRAFCGSGGTSGTCVNDECVSTLDVGTHPFGVAADVTNVYWTDVGAPGVFQLAIAGGNVVTLSSSSTGAKSPGQIATDGTYVFWTDLGSGSNPGAVVRSKIGGASLTTLVAGLQNPQGLATANGHVYWTDPTAGGVYSTPSGGASPGTVTTLATSEFATAIAVDPVNVYWTTYTGIFKVPLAGGGSATTLYTSQTYPSGIAVHGSSLYWTNNDASGSSGSVASGPISGGTPTTLAVDQSGPTGIALNASGSSVYWVNTSDPGEVMRAEIGTGGALTTLVIGLDFPQGIAVGVNDVFWTNYNGATVQSGPE